MSDQSGPTNPSQIVGAVFNGMRINPMRRGGIMGWRKGGQIIRALNALLHWSVSLCDGLTPSIQLADNGVLLLIPKPGTGSGTPAVINWLGEYNGSTDYAVDDLVYVTSGTSRSFYLCAGINGPGSAVHAPSTGTTTAYWECYANGGSGGLKLMVLDSYAMDATNGDYLMCSPIGGGTSIKVGVEPHLQSAITTQSLPDGTVWSYSSYSSSSQQRTATQTTGGTAVLTEYMTPPLLAGDIIPVFTMDPVTIGSSTFTLIAITGRQWASPTTS